MGNIFLSGEVVTDDGAPLTERAAIRTICKGQGRTETHTDSHGRFSFEFVTRTSALMENGAGIEDADSPLTNSTSARGTQRDWRDCQLQAELPGFTSEVVELSLRVSALDRNDVGRIVLHRLEHVQGTTISATSAAAPSAAKKAFEKGRDKEMKNRWDQAQQEFEKAVQIYPPYAVAWCELGRVQMHENDAAGAAHSFNQALAADPRYATPYQGLAQLAFRSRQWQEVVNLTDKLLALNPVDFPDAWFFNAVSSYFLQNFERSEKSARQGIRVDEEHTIPKLEYVLGMVLMEKHEYQEAAVHMRQYLRLVHNPADVGEAQKQLAEIARLSTTAGVPTAVEKK
ncbi:MAG TPA: tetratricopeptide repeat protein [Terriglobales bacterium]|nr:tetratricopeptide repeat protein [Terriglobales bacterium]